MPTYHTEIDAALPALARDLERYILDLEALHTTIDRFLRKRKTIRDLRQAMRQAEAAGLESGRLKTRGRRKSPGQQPGQNLQPPRECEYCGNAPADAVVWINESTGQRWKHFLCADCDEREIRELNQ